VKENAAKKDIDDGYQMINRQLVRLQIKADVGDQ